MGLVVADPADVNDVGGVKCLGANFGLGLGMAGRSSGGISCGSCGALTLAIVIRWHGVGNGDGAGMEAIDGGDELVKGGLGIIGWEGIIKLMDLIRAVEVGGVLV